MSPEVDEIIPVSLGGSPIDRTNAQLAHRICNHRKSNKVLVPIEDSGEAFETSQDW